MTTPRPPFHHRDRLSAEERAIADRLDRNAPGDGPSAALDARILAAARAAAVSPRDRRRWPAMLGIAATLVIAVGVAWQLRPLAEAPTVQGEIPAVAALPAPIERAKPETAAAHPMAEQTRADAPDASPAASATPVRPAPRPAAGPLRDDVGTPRQDTATANRKSAATTDPASAVDLQRQMRPAPAPAAGDAAPSAFPAAAPSPAPPAASMQRRAAAAEDNQDSAAAPEATAQSAAAAADAVGDERLPPDAWLDRIRQQRDAGDADAARDSLERFLRAHPDRTLPEDLRALLETPAR